MNEFPLMQTAGDNIVLLHPHMPATAIEAVTGVLKTRWIGQGPKVEQFEQEFSTKFCNGLPALAVGSGTDALHLAYILAGVGPGDEVITPIFTCTATNIPFLYMGAKVVFADIQADTMNLDPVDVRRRITPRTKAIVCVHYGGLPCDMAELQSIAREHNLALIEDAAHAVGAEYRGASIGSLSDFTMFSFQAVKHITTGDGGMLIMKNQELLEQGRRIRWFGIDRKAKQGGIWQNDITEVGYKYQMTDISAAMGLAAMAEIDETLALRRRLFTAYEKGLAGISGVTFVGAQRADRVHGAWLCTVLVEDRTRLQAKLREHNIESAQVHYRNDRYSILGGRRPDYPNMDAVEDKYLVLPLHTKLSLADVERVCSVIRSGW